MSNTVEKAKLVTPFEIIEDYAQYSTIQGLIYIFLSYQNYIGKIVWGIVIVFMFLLGCYWCVTAYQAWMDQPVLTTITTTALPIEQITFPSLTICSYGKSRENLAAGFFNLFFTYLAERNATVGMSAFEAAVLTYQNVTSLKDVDKGNLDILHNLLNSSHYEKFINKSFPGLTVKDNVLSLLKLSTSKNPDNDIAAEIAFEGGYDPCDNTTFFDDNSTRKKRQASTKSICDEGFYPDPLNQYCYTVLDDVTTKDAALENCASHKGQLLNFESDTEVLGFTQMLMAGTLKLPTNAKSWFWMEGAPKVDENFYMNGIQINTFFKRIQVDMTFKSRLIGEDKCLRVYYNDLTQQLAVVPSPCSFQSAVICRKISTLNPYCKGGVKFIKKSTIDWMVDPDIKANKTRAIAHKKSIMKDMMFRLNQTQAYETLFSILWYANLPCFDVKGVTAARNGDRSGVNFTKVLQAAFTHADPKTQKDTDDLTVFLRF